MILKFRKKQTLNIEAGKLVIDSFKISGFNEILTRYAVAQSAHETAGFTSDVFLKANNGFGMKYAGQLLASGSYNEYAKYNSINNSVSDFIKWYNNHRAKVFSLPLVINSIDDYVRFLKNNNYFEADESEYLKGCKYFLKLIYNE